MKIKFLVVDAFAILLSACTESVQPHHESVAAELLTIAPQKVELSDNYSASIRGTQDIRIIPRVEGYLTKIAVQEGEKVKEGQVLFVVDQVPFIADLKAAKANVGVCKANVENAKLTLTSKKTLREKEIISDFELNTAAIALQMAEAQLEQAKAQELAAENNLSYSVIKSPSNGVVGKINFRQGDYVNSALQEGLTIVSNTEQMFVYFSMSEADVMRLIDKYGDIESAIKEMPEVKLQVANKKQYSEAGRVESISGSVDATTVAVSLKFGIAHF